MVEPNNNYASYDDYYLIKQEKLSAVLEAREAAMNMTEESFDSVKNLGTPPQCLVFVCASLEAIIQNKDIKS